MKKLLSAATSLVMAATMVAAAAPVAVSAADATKGFSVKTYDSKNPSAASAKSSITINKEDIPAGGYVIPTALYYSEATVNSTDSLLVALTTDSKDISFKYYDPADVYADEASTYTINGTEFTTNRYISFAGYCNSKREGYKAGGKYVFGCDPSQAAAGTDNYFLGCSWMNNGVDYKWAGDSSDAYPFYVFDTVIPQSIKAGTYTVKFCDYNTDSTGVNNNPSPMVEGAGSRYTIKGGTDLPLKLEEFTINVVEPGQTPETTTTAKPVETTTTTAAPVVTTTTQGQSTSKADVTFDFVEYNSQKASITAKAGDKIDVDVNINAGSNDISALDVLFKLSDGLKLDAITGTADAFPTATVSSNVAELRANYATLKGDTPLKAENGKSAFQLTVEVPAGTPDGVYTVGFGNQCKVFKDNTKFNYETAFTPLTITVGNPPITTTEKPAQTTAVTTEKPVTTSVTTQAQPSNADVKFDFVEYNSQKAAITAKAGDSIDVDVNINAGTNDISALDVLFKLSDGLKLDAITGTADAFPTATVSSNVAELRANYATLKGDTPLKAENGKSAFQLTVVVPAGTPDGVYTVGFGDQCKVFKDNTKFNYTTSFTPLTITVGETPVETTTTTEKVTTTEKETTTTVTSTTVTTTAQSTTTAQGTTTVVTPGAKLNVTLWGDTNCDGKVNVADVVVLNRLLNDPSYIVKNPETKADVTAHGKVNADVVDPQNKDGKDIDPTTVKLTAADSEAIAMSILEKGTIPQ